MKIRDWLNNNSAVVTVGAVVVLILSLGYIVWSSKGTSRIPLVRDVYFYDMNTKKLFVGKNTDVPPIDTASGPTQSGAPAGVKAYVFACTDCDDENDRFIGYLEMYTPQARAILTRPVDRAPAEMSEEQSIEEDNAVYNGLLVKAPEDQTWALPDTPEAERVQGRIHEKCPDGRIKQCLPGR